MRLYRQLLGALAFLAFVVVKLTGGSSGAVAFKSAGIAGLSVREEPARIVMTWNGPVQEPMSERFQETFERFEEDPRPILISLNSPGGLVEHGREVMKVIHKASRTRVVDTLVEAGKMCASMCVPIFLVGGERMANPNAKFMFHQATIRVRPEHEQALRDLQRSAPGIDVAGLKRSAEQRATDEMWEDDFGPRSVDARWLNGMRDKIRRGDVWLTGKQLMDQRSGVVDRLM